MTKTGNEGGEGNWDLPPETQNWRETPQSGKEHLQKPYRQHRTVDVGEKKALSLRLETRQGHLLPQLLHEGWQLEPVQ